MKRNLNNSSLKEMKEDIAEMLHGNPKAIQFVYDFLWTFTGEGDKEGGAKHE